MPMLKKYMIPAVVLALLLGSALTASLRPVWLMDRLYTSDAISEVKLSPSFYKGGPVTIAGKVVEYNGHFGVAAYKIADKTGDILVFFDNLKAGGPNLGTYVITRGNIEEIGLPGMKTGIFIREQNRIYSSGGEKKIPIKNNSL